jgi:methyl-accepting chemotaxis protein
MGALRIKALATIIVVSLVLSGGAFISSSLVIHSNVIDANLSWRSYQDESSPKARALGSLVTSLGFGGMIHQFKNYVLRQDKPRIKKIINAAGGALVALKQYEAIGVSNAEAQAIRKIRKVINLYTGNMNMVEGLVNKGFNARDIDKKVKISDGPALEGIAFLMKSVAKNRKNDKGQVTKTEVLSDIRNAMGFGSMIHQFKNYILRQDIPRIGKLRKKVAAAYKGIADYQALGTSRTEKSALNAIKGVVAAYDKNIDIAMDLAEQGKTPEQIDSVIKIDDSPALNAMRNLITDIASQNEQLQQKLTQSFNTVAWLAMAILSIAIFSTITLITLSVWALRYRIVRPIHEITDIMGQLAAGETDFDLTKLEGDTEIGHMALAVDVFRKNSLEKVNTERETAEQNKKFEADKAIQSIKQMAQTMEEVNSISFNLGILDNHSGEVSSSSQTIASAAEQLVASVDEISVNSEGASSDALETDKTVSSGLNSAQTAMGAIQTIWEAMEDSVHSLEELTGASNQIEQILNVIEDIAEQTNLLALNATIEAARAGEAGKGFAVVANEVKNLANQSSKATEDIAKRIQALKAGMENVSQTMNKSHDAVDAGRESIDKTAQTMELAAQQVSSVSNKMTDITGILHQQKGSSSEIAKSINEVAEFAQESQRQIELVLSRMTSTNDMMSHNIENWYDNSSHRSLCEIAKVDHILFKKKVTDAVMGGEKLLPNDLLDHNNCRLGKWYSTLILPHIEDAPAFKELAEPHKNVHAAAKKALNAHNAGLTQEAHDAIHEMNDAGTQVLNILDRLSDLFGTYDDDKQLVQLKNAS